MKREYNDYELVSLAQEYNEDALEILHKKYQPFIQKISYQYLNFLSKKGLDIDDIKQECSLALEEAIHLFNEQKETCFYTFAKTCIEKKMISAMRREQSERYQILNNAISLDKILDEKEGNILIQYIEDNHHNPEINMIEEEEYIKFYQKILYKLSSLEECVLTLKVQNFKVKEIACILDKDEKSIDNAIQRIRIKAKNIITPH